MILNTGDARTTLLGHDVLSQSLSTFSLTSTCWIPTSVNNQKKHLKDNGEIEIIIKKEVKKFSVQPRQYQDVKVTLRWWTAIILAFVGILFYSFVLPETHRVFLSSLLPFPRYLDKGFVLIISGFVGYFLIFFLEIHDKIYDLYFTRWRYFYDLDYIIPTLVRPYIHKLDARFFDVCQAKLYQVMKVYYHFVGDYEHEHKIKENLIVRFYEAVTKYWITQINEILLFLFAILTLVLWPIYKHLVLPLDNIVVAVFVIIILFIVNRIFVGITRNEVRRATADELEDIHKHYQEQLDKELAVLHNELGLNYGKNQN